MAEILHQFIGSLSHFLGFHTSQVVQDFSHQQDVMGICMILMVTLPNAAIHPYCLKGVAFFFLGWLPLNSHEN